MCSTPPQVIDASGSENVALSTETASENAFARVHPESWRVQPDVVTFVIRSAHTPITVASASLKVAVDGGAEVWRTAMHIEASVDGARPPGKLISSRSGRGMVITRAIKTDCKRTRAAWNVGPDRVQLQADLGASRTKCAEFADE